MLIALVAIALLIASVGAIYFILRSMGQDGVEIAAPGSCKSGRCGVRNAAGVDAGCHDDYARPEDVGESNVVVAMDGEDAVVQQPDKRPG